MKIIVTKQTANHIVFEGAAVEFEIVNKIFNLFKTFGKILKLYIGNQTRIGELYILNAFYLAMRMTLKDKVCISPNLDLLFH